MARVLILRPQPGADETAARARALGLEPVVAPLFTVGPIEWIAPDPCSFDAVMMTSANAARHGGRQLRAFRHLPCYAVGEATAEAAKAAGFADIRVGSADATSLLTMMEDDDVGSTLHVTGEDSAEVDQTDVMVTKSVVYASRAEECFPVEAERAVSRGALVLLHSPRAASALARLWRGDRDTVSLAAISAAAAHAAGPGWKAVAWPDKPRDQALLELAARLCKTAASRGDKGNAHGL